ncbi:hypothetical protein [Winogradskyella schleiferi]|uniref:hypothetical protein n=1 Tax=Winogradskyella schleiferi TaxID=2686078 RepID=UPI0015C1085C|nr:hypothetical protein [Winogradskyella schleiferi]
MRQIDRIKNYLLGTPLAVLLREIQATVVKYKIINSDKELKNNNTVYCISPYKTGTTYLASCFNSTISQHEPIHYFSLKHLDQDFDSLFGKRLNYLNLKLECSGFWSVYLDELANHEIAKDLQYICVLRLPSKWINSVINYWYDPELEFSFDMVNELFWKPKVGVDLRSFDFGIETEHNEQIIERLIEYYFDFTRKTALLKNIKYIRLKHLDQNLSSVGSLIKESYNKNNSWQRKAKRKIFVYNNDLIDKEYNALVSKLITN